MKNIKYRDFVGYKYLLMNNYGHQLQIKPKQDLKVDGSFVILKRSGMLKIKKRYAWDGPSGPTIDTKTFMRGSLVHDAMYQLIRCRQLKMKDRKYAGQVLKEICLADGMCRFRAWYVYHLLRLFGKAAAKPKPAPGLGQRRDRIKK